MSHWTGRGYRQRGAAQHREDAYDRGYDPSPDLWQRPGTDADLGDWQEAFERSVIEARRLRDEDREEMSR